MIGAFQELQVDQGRSENGFEASLCSAKGRRGKAGSPEKRPPQVPHGRVTEACNALKAQLSGLWDWV